MKEAFPAIIAVLTLLGLGVLLHNPYAGNSLYTDIIGFFWNDFAARGLTPYVDKRIDGRPFEYPVLSGALSIIAWRLGGELEGFYATYSAFVMLAGAAMAYAALRLSNDPVRTMVYLAAPSLVVYGVYGYDVILAALTALSVLAFSRGRYAWSAALLGLGFQTKLLSVLFLPYALIKLRGRERRLYIAVFTATALAPAVVMPEAFIQVLQTQSVWSLENAWYVHIFPEAANPVGPNPAPGQSTAVLFGLAGMSMLYLYVLRSTLKPEQFMLLATSAYLLFTPRYSPQTNIMLLPFLPAAGATFFTYPIWELANSAIILTWFTSPAPHAPWSVPQTMVLIRFAALAAAFTQMLHTAGLFKPGAPPTLVKAADILKRWRAFRARHGGGAGC